MLILGVNAFHGDASAVLLADGQLVAAVEEERFTRVKHAGGLPVEAMRWVLEFAGVEPEALDHIAFSRDPHAHRARRAAHAVTMLVRAPSFVRERVRARGGVVALGDAVGEVLEGVGPRTTVHHVEHHPAHIASAFFSSGMDEAAVCSIDGLGDHVSMAWGTGRGSHFEVDDRVFFPHSLGFFYTAITQFLGFPHYGDEYKVMGLAPYGTPAHLPEMRRVLRDRRSSFRLDLRYFRHASEHVAMHFGEGSPMVGTMFTPALEALLGPARRPDEPLTDRHRDIAASAQARLEEVLLPILKRLQVRTGHRRLTLAGGVALNVTVNSRIAAESGFDEIFIQPAASDAGTSLGAALYVAHQTLGSSPGTRMEHAYYGPGFSSARCEDALSEAGLDFERLDGEELARRTAAELADGRIVGWFQGRMEFGPRALGNRSILCDPRRPDMKDVLNARTKRREGFRPFAPAVLAERVHDVFVHEGASPFMLFAPPVRPEWRDRLPAVTHVDGTARVQTVHRETNEPFWRLLTMFDELTGVPVLLNTSFNENEPIVCTPEEAIACYLRADMDVLVLEDLLVVGRP